MLDGVDIIIGMDWITTNTFHVAGSENTSIGMPR
jgi:hypothetical protein